MAVMRKLTIKQENFCNYYVECGNASKACRRAYHTDNMKSETVNRKAAELLANGKITARIAELQEETKAKSDVKKADIVRLCIRVLNDEDLVDYKEKSDKAERTRTVSKTWAAERLCKMLGFDNPAEISIKKESEMSREDVLKELARLENLDNEE